jgi:hypothetical protein
VSSPSQFGRTAMEREDPRQLVVCSGQSSRLHIFMA